MKKIDKLEILDLLTEILERGRVYPEEGEDFEDKFKDGLERVRDDINFRE